ncbi:hypothetical protein CYLTODRAFT_428160 [Cylindrobasidium torrendii FP15055 ss-10]|uniref:Cation/H+ exchanger transmembrane domain-containing protein n=1 Tax=Cylindrobasidium torrendii FP15055 ss-10 TaxID=1314674 RepID=A0A0D7BTP5_9AGAR|nr:hypothetical protein CYLTODRAFT_428160 [Cylindrobasidium torrendii FP15055 ss-10]
MDSAREFASGVMKRAAPAQAGIFSGVDPSEYSSTDPIRVWVIQLVIIIGMTQILATIFGKLFRQPRVIAEVIGGVFLGPTVMGRIDGFSDTIFPKESIPGLTLTANVGLVLFLFLVGLEIDTGLIKKNATKSASISIAGLVVPLGLGAALGVGVYRQFIDPSVHFGYFVLFVAVAIGITAFPVLCRILTELKLLDTTVGVVVLSAGVGNDVVGWILLALTVALVNASSGLTALWVLLTSVGFVLFLLFPVKWAYKWLVKVTGSLEQGAPTTLTMTVTLIIVFGSAFFTDIIGVHAIFGGFLAGLIIPKENGYAISIVEKIEDLVSILLLPLYFTLSGLKTNLGLLNDGVTWGYVVLVCVVALFSKFVSCGATALATGFNWREAGAIGSLMSCKGLVELIVLNVGLQAKILDTRTFSIFVLHAIVLTFITTPLTLLFYPSKHRQHIGAVAGQPRHGKTGDTEHGGPSTSNEHVKTRFAVVLDKMEQLPAAMTLTQLLHSTSSSETTLSARVDEKGQISSVSTGSPAPSDSYRLCMDAIRLIELTDRTSAVIKSTEAARLVQTDPLISIFRTFGQLNRLIMSTFLSVIPFDHFPNAISEHVTLADTQMVILPWSRGGDDSNGAEDATVNTAAARNPFDGIFTKSSAQSQDQTSSVVYAELIRRVFLTCPCDVALFVDRGPNLNGAKPKLFLPFFGGPDDRLALTFLVQLCMNPEVTASVVWMKTDDVEDDLEEKRAPRHETALATMAAVDTVYGQQSTEMRMASDTADNIAWDRYTNQSTVYNNSPDAVSALGRITFSRHSSKEPLHAVLGLVNEEVNASGRNVIVVVGRSRKMAVESHAQELAAITQEKGFSVGSSVAKTLGETGAAVVADGVGASLLVVQTAISKSA